KALQPHILEFSITPVLPLRRFLLGCPAQRKAPGHDIAGYWAADSCGPRRARIRRSKMMLTIKLPSINALVVAAVLLSSPLISLAQSNSCSCQSERRCGLF